VKLEELTRSVKGNVQNVDDLMGSVEAMALAVTTRAAAWLSTIPTVMLTSRTVSQVFSVSPAAGLVSSIALEVVGQSCADLWLSARSWNETRRKTDPAASERLALAMMTTYFAADFILVGVLELPKVFNGDLGHLASLLFPVMQIVSILVLTERAKQFKRAAAIEAEKQERSQARSEKRSERRSETRQDNDALALPDRSESFNLTKLNEANRSRAEQKQALLNNLLNVYRDSPNLSYAEAGRQVGRSKGWVSSALDELETAGAIHRNGGGVEVMTL